MWRSLATVRKYLWRYRRGMAVGGLCLVLKDLAQALQPLMIRGAIDALGGRGALFVRFALFLLGLALLKGIFQYWMRVIIIGISRDIEYDLRNDLFRHLAASPRISTAAPAPATSWRAPPTTSTPSA